MCLTRRCLQWMLLLIVPFVPSVVWATHEVDHRFTVVGHVRDEQGQAIEEAKVRVTDVQTGQGATAFTDNTGYYEVLLHLHNENLGDEIRVTALEETKTITATFDPEDRKAHRKVQVDFGAPPSEESSDSTALWVYAAGAALIVSVFLYRRRYWKKGRSMDQPKGWKGKKKK